jgi:hypothetical protein
MLSESDMPDALNPSLLRRLMRPRRARVQPDPAEMGTAFGLEYILEQAPLPTGECGTSPHEPALPWWQRWAGTKSGR